VAESEEGPRWVEIPVALPGEGETEVFEIGDLELLLCNAEGKPFVIRDQCPHVQTSMKGGRVRGTILECPLHGGLLDLRDGSPVALPIRRPATCYPVRSAGTGWQVGLPA
jgi:nitrite reductase/ring-hydroxylating ferredoxin subunit